MHPSLVAAAEDQLIKLLRRLCLSSHLQYHCYPHLLDNAMARVASYRARVDLVSRSLIIVVLYNRSDLPLLPLRINLLPQVLPVSYASALGVHLSERDR